MNKQCRKCKHYNKAVIVKGVAYSVSCDKHYSVFLGADCKGFEKKEKQKNG